MNSGVGRRKNFFESLILYLFIDRYYIISVVGMINEELVSCCVIVLEDCVYTSHFCISGLPYDATEREISLLFRTTPGYQISKLK